MMGASVSCCLAGCDGSCGICTPRETWQAKRARELNATADEYYIRALRWIGYCAYALALIVMTGATEFLGFWAGMIGLALGNVVVCRQDRKLARRALAYRRWP